MSGIESGVALSNYVSATAMPVATLLATYPASSTYLGMYGIVTDLFGTTNEVMRCCSTNGTYYWRPQRTDFAQSITTTGGTLTLTPLVTPPILFVSGTLASNVTMNLLTTNAWPGAQFAVANDALLGILSLTLTGLVGGTTKALGLGVRFTSYFDGTSWKGYE